MQPELLLCGAEGVTHGCFMILRDINIDRFVLPVGL
jgi:hypothetical protein